MLNLNAPRTALDRVDDDDVEVYKVLVMDKRCFDIVTPLVRVNELRRHGVTLHLLLDADRQPIADVPAVYYVSPTPRNVARIAKDFKDGLYEAYHLNFSSSLPRPLLEQLANDAVKFDAAAKVERVFDMHSDFVSLSDDVFTLAQADAYVNLNDPTMKDADVERGAFVRVLSFLFISLRPPPLAGFNARPHDDAFQLHL
jgi:hypothetical protein